VEVRLTMKPLESEAESLRDAARVRSAQPAGEAREALRRLRDLEMARRQARSRLRVVPSTAGGSQRGAQDAPPASRSAHRPSPTEGAEELSAAASGDTQPPQPIPDHDHRQPAEVI
jgi:hypothetical protein